MRILVFAFILIGVGLFFLKKVAVIVFALIYICYFTLGCVIVKNLLVRFVGSIVIIVLVRFAFAVFLRRVFHLRFVGRVLRSGIFSFSGSFVFFRSNAFLSSLLVFRRILFCRAFVIFVLVKNVSVKISALRYDHVGVLCGRGRKLVHYRVKSVFDIAGVFPAVLVFGLAGYHNNAL